MTESGASMGANRTEPDGPAVPTDLLGRRVSCDGERASVLYVGPVPPTEGGLKNPPDPVDGGSVSGRWDAH